MLTIFVKSFGDLFRIKSWDGEKRSSCPPCDIYAIKKSRNQLLLVAIVFVKVWPIQYLSEKGLKRIMGIHISCPNRDYFPLVPSHSVLNRDLKKNVLFLYNWTLFPSDLLSFICRVCHQVVLVHMMLNIEGSWNYVFACSIPVFSRSICNLSAGSEIPSSNLIRSLHSPFRIWLLHSSETVG